MRDQAEWHAEVLRRATSSMTAAATAANSRLNAVAAMASVAKMGAQLRAADAIDFDDMSSVGSGRSLVDLRAQARSASVSGSHCTVARANGRSPRLRAVDDR